MMNDSISRQAVLDMLEDINNHIIDGCGYRHEWCVEWVKGLPSAQTEQTKMIKEIRKWINSGNRGNADYFIVDKIEEIINKYE